MIIILQCMETDALQQYFMQFYNWHEEPHHIATYTYAWKQF